MPFLNDTPPKRVQNLKTPNAPKKSTVKKTDVIGKSLAMFKKRTLITEELQLSQLATDFYFDDMAPKLIESMGRVNGPSFTLFTRNGKPVDLIFPVQVDVSEVSYFEPKLNVACKVNPTIFGVFFNPMFNEIENSGLTVSDQTERLRQGLIVLKLKVDDQFKSYFDDSLLRGMRNDSTENMIIDFLNMVKKTPVTVKARFGVYIDASENRIGIYSTTLLISL